METAMIAFEVSVNGKKICTAGAECVLDVGMDWVAHHPNRIGFHAGGISNQRGVDHHCEWPLPSVVVGDEITIRIVETDSPTPATHFFALAS
jgi:hypothetical protein